MSSKSPKYKVRNKSHEVIGTFSESELIEAIEAGKYSGEEEICAANGNKWQHLSSNPSFYDAFIKRVHGKDYGFEQKQEEAPKKVVESKKIDVPKLKENLTEVKNLSAEVPKLEKTSVKEAGTGLTLRDSEIQSLFKSESFEQPKEKTAVGLEQMNLPSREEEEKSLPNIELTLKESKVNKQEDISVQRNRERRRVALWGLVVVLVLAALLNLGRSTGKKEFEGFASDSSQDKKDKYAGEVNAPLANEILIEISGYYSSQDTLPGYQQAEKILNLGEQASDKDGTLLKKQCDVLAELVNLIPKKGTLEKKVKELIALGREKDPQASEFYRAESKLFLAQKNHVEAKKLALKAIETNPDDPENVILLSEVFLANMDFADSKVFLESTATTSLTHVRKQKLLARVNLETQNWRALEKAAESCVEASPAHSECYYLLAEGYAKQNKLSKAGAFLDLSARLSSFTTYKVSKQIFERLALLEGALGRTENKLKYESFAKVYAMESTPSDEKQKAVLKELGAFLVNENFLTVRGKEQEKESRPDSAFKYYIAAHSLEPKSQEAVILLGRLFDKKISSIEEHTKLETFYHIVSRENPSFAKVFMRLGAAATEQYNFEKGHKYLERALYLDDRDSETYMELAKHYYKRQDYVSALKALAKAKENNLQSDELNYYLGLVFQKLDRTKVRETLELFYVAYNLNPDNYDALSEWLKLKLILGERPFAIKFLKSLQAADPKNPEILRVTGEIYLANSEPRRAINYFHRSLDIKNSSSKTRMVLARALESIGELDTAAEEFQEASKIDPKNPEGYYESARVFFQLQNYKKLGEVVSKLLQLSPNYPGAHKLASLYEQSRGDQKKAVSEMKKDVENNPENYSFIIEFAELYMRFNLFNEAIAELSKITNLPTETDADKTKASQYLKVRLTAYYLLSGSYRLLAKPDLAEGAVKLGLKVDPQNPLLRRELCFVYADMQRFPEATRECEDYLKRNPAAEDVLRIKQKLKDMNINYY